MNFKRFDVAEEMQNLRSTPPKVAKVGGEISDFSGFSGGVPAKTQSPPEGRTLYQELTDTTPPPAALGVFPDWQGLLIKSSVLNMNVWVVRSRQEGEGLARETGHPALLLDDVLTQKGKTPMEALAALLPLLIVGTVQ